MCTYGQRTCNSNIQEGGRIRRGSRKLNFKNDRLNYIKCFENCFKLSHGSKCVIEAMYSVIGNFHFISICRVLPIITDESIAQLPQAIHVLYRHHLPPLKKMKQLPFYLLKCVWFKIFLMDIPD